MRRLSLFFILIPCLILAQAPLHYSISHFNPQYLINRTATKNQNFKTIQEISFAQSLQSSLIESKAYNSDYQKSPNPFDVSLLPRYKKAGDYLRVSMWAHYLSNTMDILVPLIGFKKETKLERVGWQTEPKEETKLSPLGYILSFGSVSSSFYSFYTIGKAGSELYQIGTKIQDESGINLSDAGRHLRTSRTLNFVSSGLSFLGLLFILNSINSVENDNDNGVSEQFWSGMGFSVTSFILKIIAVNHVGKAGEALQQFAPNNSNEWQKEYFRRAGSHLIKYNKRWDQGLSALLAGTGILLSGALISSAADAPAAFGTGLKIIGGVTAFTGYIYMDWLAPAELGAAGGNLQDFHARMR